MFTEGVSLFQTLNDTHNTIWSSTAPITIYQVNASYSNGTISVVHNRFINTIHNTHPPFNVQALQDKPFRSFSIESYSSQFGVYLFDVRIFNTTEISSISISNEVSIGKDNLPISINVPTGQFSTLQYSASSDGLLTLDVFYEPHVILSTRNNASFWIGNINLEYISNLGNHQATYQISHDINFNNIVSAGSTANGYISADLETGVYYWRIIQPDGTFTDTRRFTVTEQEESGYPIALLIIPFIFAAWPILSRRSNRNPAETFVAITMGTIACLTIAYMLMAGIIIGGITYNTMFLAFPMIPVCFYYLYMFLKNVIDNKEKVRKPIS